MDAIYMRLEHNIMSFKILINYVKKKRNTIVDYLYTYILHNIIYLKRISP